MTDTSSEERLQYNTLHHCKTCSDINHNSGNNNNSISSDINNNSGNSTDSISSDINNNRSNNTDSISSDINTTVATTLTASAVIETAVTPSTTVATSRRQHLQHRLVALED